MARHGHTWPSMAMHGHAWPDMAMSGRAWPHTAMIYGTFSMRSSFWFSSRCAKLRGNMENQGFTLFAFLPSYLGVSGSLVYFKRQGLKRSIVWYKNFLILCLVAWYSTVFVLKSMKIHGNPCKSTRSTLQNVICYRMSVARASGTTCGSVFGRFCV